MSSVLSCPGCKANLRIDSNIKSPVIRCPKCSTVVSVPGQSGLAPGKVTVSQPSVASPIPAGQRDRGGSVLFGVGRWLTLALAILLSLAAAVLPLVGYGGELLSYGIAGLAMLVGIVAVCLSFVARRSMLEGAVTAVFLATAGLLFSINFVVAASKTKAAADVTAKASAIEDTVRQDREKGEAAQKSAADMLKKAEESEARASEESQKAAQLVQQGKAERARLDKKSDQLAEQTAALAGERAKIEDIKDKIDEQTRQAESAKKRAAELAKKAEVDRLRAKELLDQADQKDKDAQVTLKKVTEAIDGVKLKLKAKAPLERKAAITALARIGTTAAPADYDLCEVVAFDPLPELKQDALGAIEKVQPKLYPLVVTLSLPPEQKIGRNKAAGSYLLAIQQLPAFGRAGLPLIVAQLQGQNPFLAKSPGLGGSLLQAHIEALSKIAREDKTAISLLLVLPDSPLALQNKQGKPLVGFGDGLDSLRKSVGEHLLALDKEKLGTRKDIVAYFISLLQSAKASKLGDNRVFAANALATLAPDSAIALPILKGMRLDPSEQLRNAVNDAIARIEKADK